MSLLLPKKQCASRCFAGLSRFGGCRPYCRCRNAASMPRLDTMLNKPFESATWRQPRYNAMAKLTIAQKIARIYSKDRHRASRTYPSILCIVVDRTVPQPITARGTGLTTRGNLRLCETYIQHQRQPKTREHDLLTPDPLPQNYPRRRKKPSFASRRRITRAAAF